MRFNTKLFLPSEVSSYTRVLHVSLNNRVANESLNTRVVQVSLTPEWTVSFIVTVVYIINIRVVYTSLSTTVVHVNLNIKMGPSETKHQCES